MLVPGWLLQGKVSLLGPGGSNVALLEQDIFIFTILEWDDVYAQHTRRGAVVCIKPTPSKQATRRYCQEYPIVSTLASHGRYRFSPL